MTRGQATVVVPEQVLARFLGWVEADIYPEAEVRWGITLIRDRHFNGDWFTCGKARPFRDQANVADDEIG